MEVHSFRTVVQQVTHVEAAVGRQRAYVERAKLIFRRVADTGGAVCELLDVFGIQSIIVYPEVVDVAIEQRVGSKLAASDVVQQRVEIGGAQGNVF